MAGLARVVAPGLPHHVTQWGVRRLETALAGSLKKKKPGPKRIRQSTVIVGAQRVG
jgi:hypothetical protein